MGRGKYVAASVQIDTWAAEHNLKLLVDCIGRNGYGVMRHGALLHYKADSPLTYYAKSSRGVQVYPVARSRPLRSDILGFMTDHRLSDVGGTPGGLGDFLIGFAMTC